MFSCEIGENSEISENRKNKSSFLLISPDWPFSLISQISPYIHDRSLR